MATSMFCLVSVSEKKQRAVIGTGSMAKFMCGEKQVHVWQLSADMWSKIRNYSCKIKNYYYHDKFNQ